MRNVDEPGRAATKETHGREGSSERYIMGPTYWRAHTIISIFVEGYGEVNA